MSGKRASTAPERNARAAGFPRSLRQGAGRGVRGSERGFEARAPGAPVNSCSRGRQVWVVPAGLLPGDTGLTPSLAGAACGG